MAAEENTSDELDAPPPAPAPQTPVQRPVVSLPTYPVRWTYAVIGIIAFVFVVGCFMSGSFEPSVRTLYNLGAKYNPAIRAGQWWRLLAPIVLYYSPIVLGVNLYALYCLSDIERQYGAARYLAIFALAGLSGSVASFGLDNHLSIATSGAAIFGLLGTRAAYYYSIRDLGANGRARLQSVLVNIAIVVALNLFLPNTDYAALFGGLLGGTALGYIMRPRYSVVTAADAPPQIVDSNTPRRYAPLAAGVVSLLFVALVVFLANPALASTFK